MSAFNKHNVAGYFRISAASQKVGLRPTYGDLENGWQAVRAGPGSAGAHAIQKSRTWDLYRCHTDALATGI